jgi:hypothetical protein
MNDKSIKIVSSQTNQQKILEIGLQIVEKRKQKEKLTDFMDTLTKDITRGTTELREATTNLTELESELAAL